jgi:oligosaccharide repeat unit polymerase
MEYIYLLINTVLYCLLLLYFYKKSNRAKEIVFLFSLWIVVSIASIFFRNTPIYFNADANHYNAHQHPITLLPFIYLFVLFVIYSYPFIRFNSQSIKKINYNNLFVKYLTIIISICAYLPFIENILYVFLGGGSNLANLAQSYGTGTVVYRSHMSFLGARLNSVLELTAFVTPILLFLYLNNIKKNIFITIGLIFAVLNIPVAGFTSGSRGVAISALIQIVYVYLLIENTLNFKIRKYVKTTILSITAIVTIVLVFITIFRFSDAASSFSDFSILDWVLLYTGESFCNFNSDMWWIHHFTDGSNCFADLSIFGEIQGRNISGLADITKVRMHVFYTGFGDLYADFGRVGTFLIIAFLSLIIYFVKLKKSTILLSDLILLVLYGRVLAFGMFFYAYMISYRTLIISLVLVIILKLKKS